MQRNRVSRHAGTRDPVVSVAAGHEITSDDVPDPCLRIGHVRATGPEVPNGDLGGFPDYPVADGVDIIVRTRPNDEKAA